MGKPLITTRIAGRDQLPGKKQYDRVWTHIHTVCKHTRQEPTKQVPTHAPTVQAPDVLQLPGMYVMKMDFAFWKTKKFAEKKTKQNKLSFSILGLGNSTCVFGCLQNTLGSPAHHLSFTWLDDFLDDRWQLDGCSRTMVSVCGLWYSLGPVGFHCCVLLNNPNPLSPPWPTSVLWLLLVFLLRYTPFS